MKDTNLIWWVVGALAVGGLVGYYLLPGKITDAYNRDTANMMSQNGAMMQQMGQMMQNSSDDSMHQSGAELEDAGSEIMDRGGSMTMMN